MTGLKSNDVGASEFLTGLAVVLAVVLAIVAVGALVTWFTFNTLGVAAWIGLGHLSLKTALGVNLVLAAIKFRNG